MELKKIADIKLNPNNPRLIKDDKFKKLVQSIKDFPEMLEIRPIVVNKDMIILGGNMRFRACKEAGIKEIPVIVTDLSEEKQREFLIKDNTSGGEWDWDMLANEWDTDELSDWGLDVWKAPTEVDYSILDEEDLSEQLSDMTNGVKKAIQIEFEAEHYEEAQELVKFWRSRELYIGGFLIEKLKEEKLK
jgi:ParB-like chromosome segregation protein Spo0J